MYVYEYLYGREAEKNLTHSHTIRGHPLRRRRRRAPAIKWTYTVNL